ncbi:hypothetical protein EDC01DRAFT_704884 [Geopyxis carbonaria]|nr:hypothetical protein EDC01DRAFT_704884 [Geopyxis carbonaria]
MSSPPTSSSPPSDTFWTPARIAATTTPAFITSTISTPLRPRLSEPLDSGLSSLSYTDWITSRTPALFLLLASLSAADAIFSLIDNSWDDDDLPLSPASITRLGLPSPAIEKRFAKRQWAYIVREIPPGGHIDYDDDEVVPVHAHAHGRVSLPGSTGAYYTRRRAPAGSNTSDLALLHSLGRHPHIASLHASYTQHGSTHHLLSPPVDLSLSRFLATPSLHPAWKTTPKPARTAALHAFLPALASALQHLHTTAGAHGSLRPAAIAVHPTLLTPLLIPAHPVDPGCIDTYAYAAPELWQRTTTAQSSGARAATSRLPAAPSSAVNVGCYAAAGPSAAADVFSLGAVFADILTLAARKKVATFAAKRSAGNRRPRESAPPDASFHKNLRATEAWIAGELAEGGGVEMETGVRVVRGMLRGDPGTRWTLERVLEELQGGRRWGSVDSGIGEDYGWQARWRRGSVGSRGSGISSLSASSGGSGGSEGTVESVGSDGSRGRSRGVFSMSFS